MSQHTPGSWTVEHSEDDETLVSNEVEHIATIWRTAPAYEANARLIAAAPELLEALKNMLTALRVLRDGRVSAWDALVTPDLCTQWDRAKAAIAKAEKGA